ncbi:MIR motif-containing protein [Jimgerdemannia flammicorona]|uniref:MIR motif-containing protein n=1 Tax=Jimgerdemannia flammicorona TaxID=994334 RepID=A0A433D8I9_9FUNG|nr:MIR motif-containing protein [Jimgerdemannia flammicorona]
MSTPHEYPLFEQTADNPIVKIGTKLALKHVPTGRFLHTDSGHYTSPGSGQVLVYAHRWTPEPDDFWQVLPANGDVLPPGVPVKYGQTIRLRHVNTKRHLHSHHGFQVAVSKQQEVTAFGSPFDSDTNDHWIVHRWGTGASGAHDGEWNSFDIIVLTHKPSQASLHSHDISIANDVQEVTVFGQGGEENDKWAVHFQ